MTTINIVCTSKPADGLLYYSYEYCSLLNQLGVSAQLVVVCHKKFSHQDYINAIKHKYIHCENVCFSADAMDYTNVTLIMGRSMMTLAFLDFSQYSHEQQKFLHKLFSSNVISVYSENHPADYLKAIDFFNPKQIIDLCDTEVYPNGVGEHFEKTINFEIYKTHVDNVQFKYLFLGTNERYYRSVEKVIDQYPDHGILTYNEKYVNIKNNNVFAPVENLLGMFDTYVYTKETFDPAPRIFQECKYFNKEVIYLRDKTIVDGGSVYWKRDIKNPDVGPILRAIEELYEN
jgi:hypothetical protein